MQLMLTPPKEVIREWIGPNGNYPNNTVFPLLIYKQAISLDDCTTHEIQQFLKSNHWVNSWVDGVYDYHHYHSNSHETLVIIEGQATLEIGGEAGKHYDVVKGDVIILPAGVAHKRVMATTEFKCIGAYPTEEDCDMQYGKAEEHPRVDENIAKVGLPKSDPVYGDSGLSYWKLGLF